MRDGSEREPLLSGDAEAETPCASITGRACSRATRYAILAGIWLATFLSSANSTLIATVLSDMSSEFNQAHQASWLGTSYLLATCTFTPLYGRLCDIIGRRAAVQTAIVLAVIGCVASAMSQNMLMLIVARFIAGLGGGGIMTTATIVTSDLFDLRSRGITQGLAMVCNSFGMGAGGPVGGFISDQFGWRWAFLIQIPLFCLSFTLIAFNLRYSRSDGKTIKDMTKRIDLTGTVLLLGSVLCFLLFLSYHANDYLAWSNPLVYWSFIGSFIFGVIFLVFELRVAREPVLAPFLLKQKVPLLVGISNFCVAMCNFAVLYYFPMWFRTVRMDSAGRAGAHLIPNGVSFSAGSLFAGIAIHYIGSYKMLDLLFGVLPIVGTVLLSTMREDSSMLQLWLNISPLGFGNAVALQAMTIARLAHLPESCIAVGTGFGQLFRGLGQVAGVAISSAIFQAELNDKLWERIHGENAADIIQKIRRSAKVVSHLSPEVQRIARDCYAESIHKVFIFAVCAAVVAYAARLPIPDKKLDAKRVEDEENNADGETRTP